jgi:hypothetical protein
LPGADQPLFGLAVAVDEVNVMQLAVGECPALAEPDRRRISAQAAAILSRRDPGTGAGRTDPDDGTWLGSQLVNDRLLGSGQRHRQSSPAMRTTAL